MAAEIAIETIAHVDQLFGDHDLQGSREFTIDALEVDEDRVLGNEGEVHISSAIAARHGATDPTGEGGALGGDAHEITRQGEHLDVAIEMAEGFLVRDVQPHRAGTPDRLRVRSGYHTLTYSLPTTGERPRCHRARPQCDLTCWW